MLLHIDGSHHQWFQDERRYLDYWIFGVLPLAALAVLCALFAQPRSSKTSGLLRRIRNFGGIKPFSLVTDND
jgi:hypothetical protein